MRQADLYTGAGKLRDAIKSLRAVWLQTEPHWRDAVGHDFQQNYWQPIERQTLGTIQAVTHIAEILARAEHECS